MRIFSHNLDKADYSYLIKQIQKRYFGSKTRDEEKTRTEYDVLLDFMFLNPQFDAFEIKKETRPDFVLNGNRRIGIEVTEFTTESDSVLKTISNQNWSPVVNSQNTAVFTAVFVEKEKVAFFRYAISVLKR